MTEPEMVRIVIAEMRAADLLKALRNAIAGAPHWRWEAQRLIREIDGLVLPVRAAEILDDACRG